MKTRLSRFIPSNPRGQLIFYISIALVVAAIFVAAFVGIVGLSGGLRTRGSYLDWSVVAALAGFAAAIGAIALNASLALAVHQARAEALEADRRRQFDLRMTALVHGPYVRVDIGFADWRQANFSPPMGDGQILTAPELRVPGLDAWLRPIAPQSESDGLRFLLWMTNIAEHPLAVADAIRVHLQVLARVSSSEEQVLEQTVTLAYLAPGQTTIIDLGRVSRDLDEFVAEVTRVEYRDRFGNNLRDCHGAMILTYDGSGVTNDRTSRRFPLFPADDGVA